MIGPDTSVHRPPRRLQRRLAQLDVPLDVLDDDDRVVHDDADRQHEAEERQRVEREAERRASPRTCRSSDTGTATSGMIDARHVCRKTIDDDDDEQDRLEQRVRRPR